MLAPRLGTPMVASAVYTVSSLTIPAVSSPGTNGADSISTFSVKGISESFSLVLFSLICSRVLNLVKVSGSSGGGAGMVIATLVPAYKEQIARSDWLTKLKRLMWLCYSSKIDLMHKP